MHVMRTGIQLSARAAAAAAIAFWVASFFDSHYAVYALVAAVIVTDLSPDATRALAWQRLAGTLVGALIGASMTYVALDGAAAAGLGILIAMLLSYLLGLNGGAKVAGYVAAIVLLVSGSDPWTYAVMRAWDTALGIVSALMVSLVPMLMREREREPT